MSRENKSDESKTLRNRSYKEATDNLDQLKTILAERRVDDARITQLISKTNTAIHELKNVGSSDYYQARNLRALLETSYRVSQSLDPDIAINTIFKSLASLIKLDRMILLLKNPDKQALEIRKAMDKDGHPLAEENTHTSSRLLEKAEQEKIPFFSIPNASEAYDYPSVRNASYILILPLFVEGDMVGIIYCDTNTNHLDFKEGQQPELQNLANQLAVAIWNAILYGQLQAEKARIVAARTAQFRDLSDYLHNDVCQSLYALQYQCRDIENSAPHNNSRLTKAVRTLMGNIDELTEHIRAHSVDLFPEAIKIGGLRAALNDCLKRFSSVIEIENHIDPNLPDLPENEALAAFHIVTNALYNVQKHAKTRNCSVTAYTDQAELHLAIADHGVGHVASFEHSKGLTSSELRANEVGGTFKVEENSGGGTLVTANIPISALAKGDAQ